LKKEQTFPLNTKFPDKGTQLWLSLTASSLGYPQIEKCRQKLWTKCDKFREEICTQYLDVVYVNYSNSHGMAWHDLMLAYAYLYADGCNAMQNAAFFRLEVKGESRACFRIES
jgi:hypothetical protein